jgi:phosphoribosylanthranilate isomerase
MRAIGESNLSLLQFHGDEPSDFCTQFGLMSVKALRVQNAESLKQLENFHTDAFLLDAHSQSGLGGTGEKFNWDLAVEAQKFWQADFSRGRFDAGKCGGRRAEGAAVRRGCRERR